MASPVIESSVGTTDTGFTNPRAVPLPATVSAGALLIAIVRAATSGTIGFPAGWTIVFQDSSDGATGGDVTAWAYKSTAASGSEDSTTISVSHGGGRFAAVTLSITGAADPATTAPESGTLGTGVSTTMNPGATTPTGGAKDYLWLACAGMEGEMTSPPASPPSSYTTVAGADTGIGGANDTNCRVAVAQRSLNASSEDPGTWTVDLSDNWTAWTIAVHPPAPSGNTYTKTGSGVIG